MKNSENFKTVWWGILVIVIGLYLYGRYPKLIEGNPSYFDVVVFVIWIGVCLAPIFQEMDLFGVKLKQQIDELNKDLNHQISLMKTELKSSIDVSNANSNQIYFQSNPTPPKDSEIPDLSEQIERTLASMGIKANQDDKVDYGIDPVQIDMLKTRLAFENLFTDTFGPDKNGRRYPITMLLRELQKNYRISHDIIKGVREVITICNYGIHGESLSEAKVAFVKNSAPGLLKALKKELEFNGL
ncbi:hypothetical protein OAP63_06310 [Vibrio sp.]|nr:hypothetical protein [Vibrio sp.]